MQALIAPQRCYIPGGLWTPKLGGKVTEGDSKRTSHVIEGQVILLKTRLLSFYNHNTIYIIRSKLKNFQII